MSVSGAVNLTSPRVASTADPPGRIKNEGKKISSVAILAPAAPARSSVSGPKISFV